MRNNYSDPREASGGTKKLLNIKTDAKSWILSVTVPRGTGKNTVLRLAGLGKNSGTGTGDIYLRVQIHPER